MSKFTESNSKESLITLQFCVIQMMHKPQSAGPVKYLLTGRLWTSPRLSARDIRTLGVNASAAWKALIMSSIWTPAETCLSRSFDITVHEETLDGVGLGYIRFLYVLLGCSFRTGFSCKATDFTLFTRASLHSEYNSIKMLCDAIQEERLPLLFSTTSSSKSSSKISLPSSKYPVPSV